MTYEWLIFLSFHQLAFFPRHFDPASLWWKTAPVPALLCAKHRMTAALQHLRVLATMRKVLPNTWHHYLYHFSGQPQPVEMTASFPSDNILQWQCYCKTFKNRPSQAAAVSQVLLPKDWCFMVLIWIILCLQMDASSLSQKVFSTVPLILVYWGCFWLKPLPSSILLSGRSHLGVHICRNQ